MGVSAGAIRAGKAYVTIGTDDTEFVAGLKRAQRHLQRFADAAKLVGTHLMGWGAAILAPLGASIKVFADAGDRLDKMSQRTGMSVEALSELDYAAKLSGTSLEGLEGSVRKMQKAVASGDPALADLGLSLTQLKELSPEKQFEAVADTLAAIKDPTERAAAAMTIFGKSGTGLLPLVQNGTAGLDELRAKARALGLTMSGEAATKAAKLGDALDTAWKVAKQTSVVIGEALSGAMLDAATAATGAIVQLNSWIRANHESVIYAAKLGAGIVGVGAAFYVMGTAISVTLGLVASVKTAVLAVGTAASTLGAVLAGIATPLGAVTVGFAGLGGAALYYSGIVGRVTGWLGERFKELDAIVSDVVSGITAALSAGDIGLAADVLWKSLKVAWIYGAGELELVWQGLTGGMPQLFAETKNSLGTLWNEALYEIELAFIDATAALSATWANFSAGIEKATSETIGYLAKEFLKLRGLFDSSFNPAAATKIIDQELAATDAQIAAKRDAAKREREADSREARDSADFIRRREQEALDAALTETITRLTAATGAESDKAKAELRAAREALEAAIAKARTAREAVGSPTPALGMPVPQIDVDGLRHKVDPHFSVSGTFNASAAWGMSAGETVFGSMADDIAKISEDIAAMRHRADSSEGLVFAP